MSNALLQVDKIEVVYKRVITAVQGITLSVAPGQIVALLGTNGAGKTTTLRAISGFLGIDDARVTEGAIAFAGTRIENRTPHEIASRGIVLVPTRRCSPILRWRRTSLRRYRAPPMRRSGGVWTSRPIISFHASSKCVRASVVFSPAASGRC